MNDYRKMYPGLPQPPEAGQPMLPQGTYADKTILITSGGTGLGKAMAIEIARLGGDDVIARRSPQDHTAGPQGVKARRPGRRRAGRRAPAGAGCAGVRRGEKAFGVMDVLINNAAGDFAVPAADLSPNGWRAVTDIVMDGTFFYSSEFARRDISAKEPVAILNTLAGILPDGDHSTNMLKQRPEGYQAEWRRVPALQNGRIHELGRAANYLYSPYTAYVTRMDFMVDGTGRHRKALRQQEVVPIREQLAPREAKA